MATVVLHPRECLKLRFHPETLPSSPKSRRKPKSLAKPTSDLSFRSKRRTMNGGRGLVRDVDRFMVVKFPTKNLDMEKVKILKRGEELQIQDQSSDDVKNVTFENKKDLMLCSTDRLDPEPDMIEKQIRVTDFKFVDGVYAGSAYVASPQPTSVPLPVSIANNTKTATKGLIRLLHLDLLR